MDKKDIYEHLAKIYLDASSKRKKKKKVYSKFFDNIYAISAVFVVILSLVFLPLFFKKSKVFYSEVSLVLLADAAKINFNFDPAKKEVFSLALNKLSLKRFKALGFSLKKSNYNDIISLRVEFENAFRERSEAYVKNIPCRWQDYKISLSDFKDIKDWSQVTRLSFVVEEWNAKDKSDVVYIDNVRLLR